MKPNKARLRAWVRALRSGKFEQSYRQLKTAEGYCCLGVACEVFRQATGKGRWTVGYEFNDGKTTDARFLPQGVVVWFGLPSRNPTLAAIGPAENSPTASAYNDRGVSFKRIAYLIERRFGLLPRTKKS